MIVPFRRIIHQSVRVIALATFVLLNTAVVNAAEAPQPSTGQLRIEVVDVVTMAPIAGATVMIAGTPVAAKTDASGLTRDFSLAAPDSHHDGPVQAGEKFYADSTIDVTAPGYRPARHVNVHVVAGVQTTDHFWLQSGSGSMDVLVEQPHALVVPASRQPPAAALRDYSVKAGNAPFATSQPGQITIHKCHSWQTCSNVTLAYETYLRGVLPAEWNPAWNAGALNAGAITTRTYGIFVDIRWCKYRCQGYNFDITNTTDDQVWGTTTTTPTDNAVAYTSHQQLDWTDGKAAYTEYCAWIGYPSRDGSNDLPAFGNLTYLASFYDGYEPNGARCPGMSQNGTQYYSHRYDQYWMFNHYYRSQLSVVNG